jgi:hypothetical protein
MQDSLPTAVQGMAAARATRLYGDAVLNAAVCTGTLRARHSNVTSSLSYIVSDGAMRHKSHRFFIRPPRKPVRPMRNPPLSAGTRTLGNHLFQAVKSQILAIKQALETAALMLGTGKFRSDCLEMICSDFLAGAILDNGNHDARYTRSHDFSSSSRARRNIGLLGASLMV